MVLRIAAPIFFANGSLLADRISELTDGAGPRPRVVVLDLEAVSDIDVTGADALRESIRKLADEGIGFAYTRMRLGLREQFAGLELTRERVNSRPTAKRSRSWRIGKTVEPQTTKNER